MREGAEQEQEWWLRRVAGQEEEWLRQNNLAYGGLIGIGVVMVQQFLTAASLDLSAKICVVAFSVAIPLLAALVMVNRQEAFRRRATRSGFVSFMKGAAQVCAFVGVVAAFWHIMWIAGVGFWQVGSWGWQYIRQATRGWNGMERPRPRNRKNPATPTVHERSRGSGVPSVR